MLQTTVTDSDIHQYPIERRTPGGKTMLVGKAYIVGTKWGEDEVVDWNLSSLYRNEPNPVLNARLAQFAEAIKVQELYAPMPDFSGRICDTRHFPFKRKLGRDIYLHFGAQADGMQIPQGAAKLTPTGGCGEFVATDGNLFVSAHMGFRSIFRHDEPGFISGVATIAKLFRDKSELERTSYFYSIRPEVFTHSISDPVYAERNRLLRTRLMERYPEFSVDNQVAVDMPTLVRMECGVYNLPRPKKGLWCYLPSNGFVHTRMREPYRQMRNLLAIVRKN